MLIFTKSIRKDISVESCLVILTSKSLSKDFFLLYIKNGVVHKLRWGQEIPLLLLLCVVLESLRIPAFLRVHGSLMMEEKPFSVVIR